MEHAPLLILLLMSGGICMKTPQSDDDQSSMNNLYDVEAAIHDDQPLAQDTEGDPHLKGEDSASGIFLVPRIAKSFLRVRRWGIKSLWGEEQEEESESRERSAEHHRAAQLANTCRSSCWGQWLAYSACTVQCGSSGTQRSTRSHAPPAQCRTWVSQNGCPGDSTRTQACNRACQNGGSLQATNCACPAGYTGTCCEHRVTCGYPDKPSNGAVTPAGSRHNYGTVATYTCSAGYSLQGSSTRTCQHNGQWSGSLPTCQIISCRDPGSPAHGSRQGTNFQYSANVVFSCNTGHILHGEQTITCGANGQWNHGLPTCQPVECPVLPAIPGGIITVPSRTFNNRAAYKCNTGFYMVGNMVRICGANGQWTGAQPSCTRITCPPLTSPQHGTASPQSDSPLPHGTRVQFTCSDGFTLHGPAARNCEGDGQEGAWSGTQPTCQPVDCGNPGVPINGAKQGGVYTFGSTVTFQCQPGYKQGGSVAIQCQATGRWSGPLSVCTACPLNSYKLGLNSVTECTPCPQHSHTVSVASVGRELCVCDAGYSGQHGGPCSEILCPSLTTPANGRPGICERQVNKICNMTCNEGHVKSSGSESRICRPDGTWSGSDLTCRACPVNTYKLGLTECSPCPVYSATQSTGNDLQGCVCIPGFQGPPGGPCTDKDECQNTTITQCSQTCVNTPGSYRCSCTLPGFIQDAENPTECVAKNQCTDLEAPGNGGLVCVAEVTTNTERCQVKCNPGYEHPLRVNDFEECGPSTNWQWSNVVNDVPLLDCIEAYFAGVTMEAEVAYFIDDCNSLTDSMKSQIAESFVDSLQSRGVCTNVGTATCNVQDVTFDCGPIVADEFGFNFGDRKKRSVEQAELKVKFKIGIPEVAKHEVNCTGYCNNVILNELCIDYCTVQHKEASEKVLSEAAEKLEEMFNTVHTASLPPRTSTETPVPRPSGAPTPQGPDSGINEGGYIYKEVSGGRPEVWEDNGLTLRCAGLILVPMAGIQRKDIVVHCGPGMAKGSGSDECVPCPPGSHLPNGMNECQLCPRGTHQPLAQQTTCLPCPDTGSLPTKRGATSCNQTGDRFLVWHPDVFGVRRIVELARQREREQQEP